MWKERFVQWAALTVVLAWGLACSGGGGNVGVGATGGSGGSQGSATGTLTIEATDGFLPHSLIAAALIEVDQVQVHREEGDGFQTIYAGEPLVLDLLKLRNGIKKRLAQADLPAGTYRQIRLRLSGGFLELTNGNQYTAADGTLKLTSQTKSGLKVFVDPPIALAGGVSRTLLLDFDLTKTFKPVPGKDPLTAKTYKLHPVIKASNVSESGELRGFVLTKDGQGGLIGVGSATVSILHPGEPDPTQAITTTGTDLDGSWAVLGLAPGTYDVHAMRGSLSGRVDSVGVTIGSITVIDVEIE